MLHSKGTFEDQKKFIHELQEFGGNSHIQKVSDDCNTNLRQRAFEVKFLGERPSFGCERERISHLSIEKRDEALENFENKRRNTYSQADLNQALLMKKRAHGHKLKSCDAIMDNVLALNGRGVYPIYDRIHKAERILYG